jgi:hypothetical protein
VIDVTRRSIEQAATASRCRAQDKIATVGDDDV